MPNTALAEQDEEDSESESEEEEVRDSRVAFKDVLSLRISHSLVRKSRVQKRKFGSLKYDPFLCRSEVFALEHWFVMLTRHTISELQGRRSRNGMNKRLIQRKQ